jgi:hypothetical protein
MLARQPADPVDAAIGSRVKTLYDRSTLAESDKNAVLIEVIRLHQPGRRGVVPLSAARTMGGDIHQNITSGMIGHSWLHSWTVAPAIRA